MRLVAAILLLAACGDPDARRIQLHLIAPTGDDDPFGLVDRYTFAADHETFRRTEQTFDAQDAPFLLPAIEPGDGWIFSLLGFAAGSPWSYGRSCPTDVPEDGELPEPVVYFSRLRRFSRAGRLSAARPGSSLVPLQDGDVLVVGGEPQAQPVRYARAHAGFDAPAGPEMGVVQVAPLEEPFDGYLVAGDSSDAWRVRPDGAIIPIPAPEVRRVGARLTPLGEGRVLLTGGSTEPGMPPSTSPWIYNPESGAFEAGTAAAHLARRDHSATRVGVERVLVLGGRDALDAALLWADVVASSTTTTTSTTPTADLNRARWQHTATLLPDDRGVLVVGGRGTDGLPILDAEIYVATEPSSTQLLEGESRPLLARSGHTATPIAEGRFVLLAGGWGADDMPIAAAELYDVERMNFRRTEDMKTPRAGHAALLLCDGTMLFVGGEGEGTEYAEIYNPDPDL